MKRRIKLKNIVKSKFGMTYVELLVALALLSLIIAAFTPMLLSSYNTLYKAGEKTQELYQSQTEVEEGLARRDSVITKNFNINYFTVNGEKFFENLRVNGKKVVGSMWEGFETLFGQGRASVEIISSPNVPDDQTFHDVIIQTTGIEYSKVSVGKFADKYKYESDTESSLPILPKDQVHIEVIMPDKTLGKTGVSNDGVSGGATTDESVYTGSECICNVEVSIKDASGNSSLQGNKQLFEGMSNKDNNGRIQMRISSPFAGKPLDFTLSPVKIKVYYVNIRGKTRSVCTYLFIEPPTLLMAGEAKSGAEYYTSAGVKSVSSATSDGSGQSNVYTLTAQPRTMRTENSVYLTEVDSSHTEAKKAVSTPSSRGVTIRSIRWIDSDETAGLDPYYVMVGSEGSIYRMYNFTSSSTSIYNMATGKTELTDEYAEGNKENYLKSAFFGSAQKSTAKEDKVFDLLTGERCYPSLWSGDFAHTFEYSSARRRLAYGPTVNNSNGDGTWLTSVAAYGVTQEPAYNVFSSKVQYCYYYFGDGTDHTYPAKNFKAISYILTERGWPLKLMGTIREGGDDLFSDAFALWDTFSSGSSPDTYEVHTTASQEQGKKAWTPLAFHYEANDPNTTMMNDYTSAQIKLKSLASYPLHDDLTNGEKGFADYIIVNIGSREDNDYENATNMAKLSNVSRIQHSKGNERLVDKSGNYYGDDIELNDVIYIPGTDTTTGTTFYVGTTHAYAFLNQTDKVSEVDSMWKNKDLDSSIRGRYYKNQQGGLFTGYQNQCSYPAGSISDYIILSDQDGRSTYVAMFSGTEVWPYNDEYNVEDGTGRISDTTRKNAFIGFYNNYAKNANTAANGSNISFTYNESFSGKYFNGTDNQAAQTEFFLPEKDSQWQFMQLDDVYFTLGYASDHDRVYKYITYDGTVEYTRSAERLYWRSHYGQDAAYGKETDNKKFTRIGANQNIYSGGALPYHKLNSALSKDDGYMQSSTYLNSYNNDQYNVWFPGDMYNLTKVATKDGVTVAVGYNVSGSTYQYSHPVQTTKYNNGKYHITSTALGGIYNDGVLAAMVEGKDDSLVNLLYFKDNGTFDGTSLTDYTINGVKPYEEYKDFTTNTTHSKQGYGTHSRQSVDFTAVDLVVESMKADEDKDKTVTLNYYAYYGDSTGRLFRSLVATGKGTDETNYDGSDNSFDNTIVKSDVSLVSFIKDTTYAGTTDLSALSVTTGEMTEILVQGQSLSSIYDEILTIDATNEMVIVTGEAKTINGQRQRECIVVGTRDDSGAWTWKRIYNGNFKDVINDAVIVGGYYYIVGDDFFAAVSLDTLKKLGDGQVIQNTGETSRNAYSGFTDKSSNPDYLLWVPVQTKLYAIDGRDTQG